MTAYPCPMKLLALTLLCVSGLAHAGGASFVDGLSSEDTTRWVRTDNVYPGEPVNNFWRADHIAFAAGQMELRLNTQPCAIAPEQCASRPSASGQLRSQDTYGFGRYTAVLQAATGAGVVTDFMKYTGDLAGDPSDLIGMHIQGQDPTRMQVSYFLEGVGAQYQTVHLGFNAASSLHTYAFDWSSGALRWYVDGSEVFSVTGASLPAAEGYIVGDVWAGSPATAGLFGAYANTPTRAYFDSIAYEAAISPVPEPGSAALLSLGVGLLAWHRRRASPVSPTVK
jgi:endo-1,3-1,4-beta-glycanase ExoK